MGFNPQNPQHRFIRKFVKLYKNEPAIWKVGSPDYRDRNLKDAAYERMIENLREVDSTADREAVIKKINNLRSNCRRERKKMKQNPLYRTKLWYYDLFKFLEDVGTDDTQTEDGAGGSIQNDTSEEASDNDNDSLQHEHEADNEQMLKHDILKNVQDDSEPSTSKGSEYFQRTRKRNFQRRVVPPLKLKSKISKICEDLTISEESNETVNPAKRDNLYEEDCYVFGRYVAMKLRRLDDKTQRLLAEKLINDAVFLAEFGDLSMHHSIGTLHMEATLNDRDEYDIGPSTQHGISNNKHRF